MRCLGIKETVVLSEVYQHSLSGEPEIIDIYILYILFFSMRSCLQLRHLYEPPRTIQLLAATSWGWKSQGHVSLLRVFNMLHIFPGTRSLYLQYTSKKRPKN